MAATRRSRRHARPQSARDRIVATIRKLCATAEVTDISITDICSTAGLTTGAIYSNFANKDDAVEAAIIDVVRERYARFADGGDYGSLAELIAAIIDAVTDIHIREGKLQRAVGAIINTRPGAYQAWLASRRPVIEALVVQVERERRRLGLPLKMASYFAHMILNSIEDIAMDVFQWRNPNLIPFASDIERWKRRQVALWSWSVRNPDLS